MTKPVLCGTLALLQVLICTVGQGAFTLCVRRDGSQKMYWSRGSDCRTEQPQTACPCGCLEDETVCPDEAPNDSTSRTLLGRCTACNDYVLMAEQPTVSAVRSSQAAVLDVALAAGPFALSFLAEKAPAPAISLTGFQPPSCCATILSVVVLRC